MHTSVAGWPAADLAQATTQSAGNGREWPGKGKPRGAGPRGSHVDMHLGCGGRIRTDDLRVMSPTSCRCSTPLKDYSMSACCARPPPRACRSGSGSRRPGVLTSHLHGASPSCTRRHHGEACRTERSAGPPPRGGPTSGSKRTRRCRHPGLASRPSPPPPSRSSSPERRPSPPILPTARTSPATGWAWATWVASAGMTWVALAGGPHGRATGRRVRRGHGRLRAPRDDLPDRGRAPSPSRIDMGTVASTGETSLEYTLATGETASVTTDDATEIIAFSTETVELGRRAHARAVGARDGRAGRPRG